MEWSRVDFPQPFSPRSMISGCERSTIIGMWKFRLGKTGWPRILRYIAHQDSRSGVFDGTPFERISMATAPVGRETCNLGSSAAAAHDRIEVPIPSEVFVARITRKELKSDKFAQEVGLTVTFFEEHQKDVVRYGGIAVAAILLIGGFFIYQRHDHAARQEELGQAIRVQETPVATIAANGQQTFPTQDLKDQAAIKAFADLESKHGGSDEAE